ncbi:methyltransferase family protein [Xanthomonas campestris]|uniref:methyltransferase family protein n=1 Tax=Xanthomonas campestris TaxID=339 RepID=UPI002367C73C|nr:PEMT/PEM2 methyltransferase family protein [Xanthomonas campestris]MEA9786447.1 PEMT/PEM2 methyltransferase family protein [Xanthomonas campestris pv. raphani]WDI93618.1 phosphatidylethanolamine N-methyltransferase family protein [Xanthomonas campestris]
MSASHLLTALSLLWVGYELWLRRQRRAADGGAHDQGTLGQLWRVLSLSIAVAVGLAFAGISHWPPAWQEPLRWGACALIAGGLGLRVWAIQVLARWFTVDVTIQADHQLVRSGPYRWLRHPSYTGALLCFYGMALGMGNALSLLVIVLPVTWVFLRRIRVEEAALRHAFPTRYADYATQSWRLMPLVW